MDICMDSNWINEWNIVNSQRLWSHFPIDSKCQIMNLILRWKQALTFKFKQHCLNRSNPIETRDIQRRKISCVLIRSKGVFFMKTVKQIGSYEAKGAELNAHYCMQTILSFHCYFNSMLWTLDKLSSKIPSTWHQQ